MKLTKIQLFNIHACDKMETQKIIGGESTGISNLNNVKFDWAKSLYREMMGNFWIPEKVSMIDDKVTVKELSIEELDAVKNTLSFLIFLDSFQTNNLPNIRQYITCPAIANLITIQTFQEVVHVQSYQYLMESIFPSTTREEIYDRWRDNPLLKERNQFVADIANQFNHDQTIENFKRVLIANLILEGVYFYQGFSFFDQLASRNKLIQSDKMIDYIRTDELTHTRLFSHCINEIFDGTEDFVYEMFEQSVDLEIQWCHQIYGNKILGISNQSSEEYIKYLANLRLNSIGLNKLYKVEKNPYSYLADTTNVGSTKESFFETTNTQYSRSEAIDGWDSF